MYSHKRISGQPDELDIRLQIDRAITLAGTDLLCMLNWGTQWTMVSYLKK